VGAKLKWSDRTPPSEYRHLWAYAAFRTLILTRNPAATDEGVQAKQVDLSAHEAVRLMPNEDARELAVCCASSSTTFRLAQLSSALVVVRRPEENWDDDLLTSFRRPRRILRSIPNGLAERRG
jgi:hypothetical protein